MIYFSIEKERKRAWWKFQVPRNIWSHWFARALFRESFFLLEKRKGKKNKKEKKEKKKKDRFLVELFFFFFFCSVIPWSIFGQNSVSRCSGHVVLAYGLKLRHPHPFQQLHPLCPPLCPFGIWILFVETFVFHVYIYYTTVICLLHLKFLSMAFAASDFVSNDKIPKPAAQISRSNCY